MSLFVKLADI